MKQYFSIVLVFSFNQILCKKFESRNVLVSAAINEIIQDYFANISSTVDIVWQSDDKTASDAIVDEICAKQNDSLTYKVSKFGEVSQIKLNTSSIVLFDSAKSFRRLKNKVQWQSESTAIQKHLVYFPDANIDDFKHIRSDFSIHNVNFLMNVTRKSIDLVTSFLFTPQKCRENQFVSINRFKKTSMKWETSNFYPNKFQNIHKCQLNILPNKDLKNLLSIMTFTELVNSTRIVLDYYDPQRLEHNDLVELVFFYSQYYEIPSYKKVGHISTIDYIVIYMPPSDLYTPLEKMLLPFEFEVWIAICVTLSIGFVVIQVINCMSLTVRHFVFGRTIQTPTLNFLNIILNGSQVKTAGRNFARFIFILFVMWCLVIRTCYQSKMFENLQVDRRKPEPKTLDEFFERNFTIVSMKGDTQDRELAAELFEEAETKVTKRFVEDAKI
jgi:hypothetical protein